MKREFTHRWAAERAGVFMLSGKPPSVRPEVRWIESTLLSRSMHRDTRGFRQAQPERMGSGALLSVRPEPVEGHSPQRALASTRCPLSFAPELVEGPVRAGIVVATNICLDGHNQRGAALLMAMVILTLVATLAAGMVWQQSTAIAIETAERARAQSTWILNGALDWSRIILREDARNKGPDHLGEPWATPLAEAKLSTFLAADKNNTDDSEVEAFLSGSIEDAQSHYDLRRLVGETTKDNKTFAVVIPAELETLRRLFGHLGLPVELADSLAGNLLRAWDTTSSAASNDTPLAPQTMAQLRWLGVDETAINKMTPYATILPKNGSTPTHINLNTAPREVIAAVLNTDLGSADRLVQRRANNPFKTVADAQAALPATVTIDSNHASINSYHFEVRGRLRLGDHVQEEVALMRRLELDVSPVWRTRSQTLRSN
jgi:general secretion pathway protein K